MSRWSGYSRDDLIADLEAQIRGNLQLREDSRNLHRRKAMIVSFLTRSRRVIDTRPLAAAPSFGDRVCLGEEMYRVVERRWDLPEDTTADARCEVILEVVDE